MVAEIGWPSALPIVLYNNPGSAVRFLHNIPSSPSTQDSAHVRPPLLYGPDFPLLKEQNMLLH